MGSLNDLPQLEGIRDLYTDQIHSLVFPFLRQQGCFDEGHGESALLNRVRDFLGRADGLTALALDEAAAQKEVDALHDELLKMLKTIEDIKTLRSWVASTPPGGMVFFGGAGVSTESGIPDFRSTDGLYAQTYDYPPEQIISHSFFKAHPREFFDFYFDRMVCTDAQPNRCHLKLAELEREGTLRAVVTQNIDGLHTLAGATNVIELHGSIMRNHCVGCGLRFSLDEALALRKASEGEGLDGVVRCQRCGEIVKPDVVLYEEPLDDHCLQKSIEAISAADLLVVAGTSLVVWPAAGLLDYFHGSHLVIVNRTPTPQDHKADLCIAGNVGEVFDF